jgi:hypothetical protein
MDSVHVIRESRDQRSVDSYPGLFAVFHALHRLLAPRHPPHTLSSLAALFLPSRPWSASPRGARYLGTEVTGSFAKSLSPRPAKAVEKGRSSSLTSKARVEFARITRMPLPTPRWVLDATLITTELSKTTTIVRPLAGAGPMFGPSRAVAPSRSIVSRCRGYCQRSAASLLSILTCVDSLVYGPRRKRQPLGTNFFATFSSDWS